MTHISNTCFKSAEQHAAAYHDNGCSWIRELIAPKMASNLTLELQKVIAQLGTRLLADPRIGEKPAYEIYSYRWMPMTTFHWSLTAYMQTLVGKELLPTYGFFRSYQQDDICRIHADRMACEHSLSMTLAYGDNKPWALSVEEQPLPQEKWMKAGQEANYGDNSYVEFPMLPGDAVLYKGVMHRHGRLDPNPNRWSAHMFLHWVEKDGPYAGEAYDGYNMQGHGDFVFPK